MSSRSSWRMAGAPGWGSAGLEVGHIRASGQRDVPSRLARGRRARRPRPAFARRMPSRATARPRLRLSRRSRRDKRRRGRASPSADQGDAGSGRRPPAGRSSRRAASALHSQDRPERQTRRLRASATACPAEALSASARSAVARPRRSSKSRRAKSGRRREAALHQLRPRRAAPDPGGLRRPRGRSGHRVGDGRADARRIFRCRVSEFLALSA